MSEESLLLRQAMAYEARVTEAHFADYARVPKGLRALGEAIVARLRDAALDEPLHPDLQRRVLRTEADEVMRLLAFAGLPASRRAICEAQVARMRRAGVGDQVHAYSGVRHLSSELENLTRP